MRADFYPLRVLLLTVSGWVNRHQADVIAYLVEENRALEEQIRGRKLRLTDDQRRRLAAKAKLLGRQTLNRVATIVTPDTIMRWHHKLIALKWTFPTKRVGRPGLMKAIAALIVRFAKENSTWGYCRIQGELKDLGHRVSSTTIANVLMANGIRPAPDRPSSWRSFLRAHRGQIAGMDFVAPSFGIMEVTTCGTHDLPGVDLGIDTVLSLHDGCPGTVANEITCNDDAFGTCQGLDQGWQRDSAVSATVNRGQTVWIRVSVYDPGIPWQLGSFVLNVSHDPLPFARKNTAIQRP